MFGFFKRKPRPNVESSLVRNVLRIRYRNQDGDAVDVVVAADSAIPGTILITSNGIPVARVWVDDNGVSIGVSDTVAPIKFVS